MGRVYRFLLTPRWWGINLFVVLAIPFCVFMGSWQLGRFEDRVQGHKDASAQSTANEKAAPRPLDSLLPVDQKTSGKRATATGHYGKQFLVPDRELDGRTGFYVVTLLRTEGAPVGRCPSYAAGCPVRRAPRRLPPRPGARSPSPVRSRPPRAPARAGRPPRGLPAGQLGAISAASLVNLVPYDVYDAWVTLDKAGSGMTAVPATAPQGSGLDLKAFQNLGYTGEWFVFAGFVVFMWFRLLRREAEFARDAALGLTESDGASDAADSPEPASPEAARG